MVIITGWKIAQIERGDGREQKWATRLCPVKCNLPLPRKKVNSKLSSQQLWTVRKHNAVSAVASGNGIANGAESETSCWQEDHHLSTWVATAVHTAPGTDQPKTVWLIAPMIVCVSAYLLLSRSLDDAVVRRGRAPQLEINLQMKCFFFFGNVFFATLCLRKVQWRCWWLTWMTARGD